MIDFKFILLLITYESYGKISKYANKIAFPEDTLYNLQCSYKMIVHICLC
jgi:hypothetical protein